MNNVIEMRGVKKSFGRVHALVGLDLQLAQGGVHGLLGPNGAGKSTAIRVLLGMLRADAGEVKILGVDPWSAPAQARSRLAYVPGDVALWPNLSGGETLDILARMHGGENLSKRKSLIEAFELDPTRRSRTYSKGNRQKVALVSAFSATAELLILDEPTSGLDPLMEAVFKQCVADARRDGQTVLLSSHILSEVEQLCDRVSIVRAGQVVDTGSLADLRGHAATIVTATVTHVPRGLEDVPGVQRVDMDGRHLQISTTAVDSVMEVLVTHGIETLAVAPPTLEDLFLHYYSNATKAVSA
ncbi:ABC transporter ATP-binding protein [Paenarthrobacter sp. PH39-S1]|uniref:ABC transporter ATP-binding protein n=1 Tax=Paenarthrobacter sp. PH39-S1 TaxID=3046204 RepID=UPI0024BA0213|nr:ABC transporter ATP-binding protein [Paenarthrobacter sp. PH39-S1]MDJ0356609.1 ABC transporter ATP-binding protein [Paenarthrobacter sp. PH39-S1]